MLHDHYEIWVRRDGQEARAAAVMLPSDWTPADKALGLLDCADSVIERHPDLNLALGDMFVRRGRKNCAASCWNDAAQDDGWIEREI